MVAALLLLSGGTTTATAAQPSTLALDAAQASGGVRVTGALYDSRRRAISGRTVTLSVSRGETRAVTTDRRGRFQTTLRVPSSVPTTVLTVSGRFRGDNQFSATSTAVNVTWRNGSSGSTKPPPTSATSTRPPTTTSKPRPPTTAPPRTTARPQVVELQATASDDRVRQGYPFSVSGVLTVDGVPIQDGAIRVDVPGLASPDFSVLTGPNGTFVSHSQVPVDARPGRRRVTVTFLGGGGFPQTRTQVVITVVKAPTPTPTPTPTPKPKPSTPPVSSTPSTVAAPLVTTGSPSPTPVPQGVELDVKGRRTLALGTLGLVLVLGAASSVAYLARSHGGASDHTPTDHLID
ncbi:hypothetical protein [Aestuariimicrobium ganziense]|uniref:hypothetical protein n=1 Tax=Aestuariimicrobium ganziense TaxID=2773677 RepID=UPI001941B02B|nr:hypothetical protein [Aestuariimicrobium ganziense]